MSVKYTPVQWNRNKWIYDAVMLIGVVAFLYIFLFVTPEVLSHEYPINPQVHNARAFGACAFLMLTVILCIGPLARFDRRFLPLLYNRRHFGVMTAFVALSHASYIINWYFAFSTSDKYEALLFANTSYSQIAGFPFEVFGIFALLCLLILAATSHDFWMKFLTWWQWRGGDQRGAVRDGWLSVCNMGEIANGFAKIKVLPNGERVAVFNNDGKLSAISNACAHQNGPLGEGRIIACFVTCPWHGFQYDVTNGRSPAPFTEMVPTFNLRLNGADIEVHCTPNPPGTYVEPIPLPDMQAAEVPA